MAIEPRTQTSRPDQHPSGAGAFETVLAMLIVGVVLAIAIGALS